ncbi:ATP-grasp domain-containing protein [Gallibacterium genomosp. 2]|uniref:ATP-grasp domain-containing protein n=1 Tax=Gallibacterium genomosp. 2 TaxID=155517 RepID=UPI00068DEE86|nr:ATP-grasp domain-containing protein [Gallibacterium genomosp. 2]
MNNVILIVDPFSTGKLYAPIFKQKGFDCYAVFSGENIASFYLSSFNMRDFSNQQPLTPQQAKQQFSPSQIRAVVIGSESGVIVGEALADYFGVNSNDISDSELRRNKFKMQQALSQANLNAIKTIKITENNKNVSLFDSEKGYIVKPLNSAGSEDVVYLVNKNKVLFEITTLNWHKRNITGEVNSHYLIQEYLEGIEFVVDMVAYQGSYFVLSLCRYKKGIHNGSRFVYENMTMLYSQEGVYQNIIQYAKAAAEALDFKFGPIHMEIMLTARGPVMIEVGARLHGGMAPQIFSRCYQPHLLESAVSAYLSHPILEDGHLIKQARIVFLINEKINYRLDNEKFLQKISLCPSFVDAIFPYKSASPLPLTVDLLSCVGYISLVSDNLLQIERDERLIRQLFNELLYIE